MIVNEAAQRRAQGRGDRPAGVAQRGHAAVRERSLQLGPRGAARTFGVGRDRNAREWRSIFRQLYGAGLIYLDIAEFGDLSLLILRDLLAPVARGALSTSELDARGAVLGKEARYAATERRVAAGGSAHKRAPDVRRTPNLSEEKRLAAQRLASELLERLGPGGRLIGIDFDPANLAAARQMLERTGGRFDLFHTNFAGLPTVLAQAGIEGPRVDAVLADIGVASTQIDDPARGFSYRRPGPLDMRMDPTRGQPASALINRMSEEELAAAFLELGDEADAPRIARLIVERRAVGPITRTEELMALVCEARDFTIQRAAGAKLHPAARTFQALRILVNRELANLDRLLAVLPAVLKPGGVAAIISFHSGEDRRVKNAFRDGFRAGIYAEETRDPIVADEAERESNPRSRSAKLRWARRA